MTSMKKYLAAVVFCVMTTVSASALEISDVVTMVANGVNQVDVIEIIYQQRLPRPPTAQEVVTLRAVGASEHVIEFMFKGASQRDGRHYAVPQYVYNSAPVVVVQPPPRVVVVAPPPPPPPRTYRQEPDLPGFFQILGKILDDDHDKGRKGPPPSRHDDRRGNKGGKPAPDNHRNDPPKPRR